MTFRLDNRALAAFLARTMVGLVFAYAGFWKVFVLGPVAHGERFFVTDFAASWIPLWLLWALGLSIPGFELLAGLLLLVGLYTRLVLFACGLLLLITTYGHLLQQPLFDIDGHTFTRLALILFWLVLPADSDRLSLDALRTRGALPQ